MAFARDCCAVLTDLSCVGIQAELCAHSRTINALVLHPSADIVRPATLTMFTHNTATVTRRPSRHQQCLIHRGTHTLALALLPLVRCMSHFVMEAHSAVTQCAALPSCRCPHALRRMNSGVAALHRVGNAMPMQRAAIGALGAIVAMSPESNRCRCR